MAGRGKGNVISEKELEEHETKLNGKIIDLKRFAYDVIKHSALKFHVPEDHIAAWGDDSTNDYGYDDFCLIVSRNVIDNQILNRREFHKCFSGESEAARLASHEILCGLIQDSIEIVAKKLRISAAGQVEMSLSLICELFIFLCSKNVSVAPKELATIWFECHLNHKINKKEFEEDGGLEKMYNLGNRPIDDIDSFLNDFINDHCLPYETTANNANLSAVYKQKIQERIPKPEESLSPKSEEIDEAQKCVKDIRMPQQMPHKIGERVDMVPPKPNEASGCITHENTGHHIIPFREVLQSHGPSLASPQDPFVATPEKQTRHHKNLSRKEKMKSSLCANVKQGPGLPSSDYSCTKQLGERNPSVSVAEDTKPSYNLEGAITKTPLEQRGNAGLEIIPPDEVLQFYGPSVPSLQDPSAETPKEQTLLLRILSVQERKKNLKECLLAGLERCRRQSNSETSEMKKSSERKPSASFAKDTMLFYNLPGVKPMASEESSALRTGMPSSCSYVHQGLQQSSKNKSHDLAVDDLTTQNHPGASQESTKGPRQPSSETFEMKQSSERKSCVPFAKNPMTLYNPPGAKPKAYEGSTALRTGIPSSCSSVEQGFEQLSLSSSRTKQSSKNKSPILAADDLTTQNHPGASRQESTKECSGSSDKEEMEEKEIQEE